MSKTKIICTLGPSSTTYEQIKAMALAGMNVARINMSHGTHEQHLERINNVKRVRDDLDIPLPILIDLKGPEVRIGTFENGKIEVTAGMPFVFTSKDVVGNEKQVSITYKQLYKDVKIGDNLLLNDGLLTFVIEDITEGEIFTVAQNDGVLSDRKSLFAPNCKLNLPFLTDLDKKDLDFAVSVNAEIVAASFVQDGDCVQQIRDYLASQGCKDMVIISKIESQMGINNIDDIIEKSEGIMVARGDLGVEVPYERLPAIQKMLITKSRTKGKFAVTATEMLESMITKLRPTRAEIVDVASAVTDGSSCVMLSAESAVGINPPNTIATMAKIALEAEKNIDFQHSYRRNSAEMLSNTDAISNATVSASFAIKAKAIVVYTASGLSARMVSRFRPVSPIIAFTQNKRVYHQLATSWGVTPMMCCTFYNTDVMFLHAESTVVNLGVAEKGDNIVITAGVPLGKNVGTNLIKVEEIKRNKDDM